MQIVVQGDKIGKRLEIGEPARHCGGGLVAADPLIVVPLGIELLRLG